MRICMCADILMHSIPVPTPVPTHACLGEPPIFVGFGSMVIDDPAALAAIITQAARESGKRVLVSDSASTP